MESLRLVQNGFEEDGITPKLEPRFLSRSQSAAIADFDPYSDGQALFGNRCLIRNANGDVNDAALALQVTIDTITYLRKSIVTQSFYEVPLAKYGLIEQGDGAFMQNILVTREYDMSDDFEAGNMNQGANGERLSEADTATDAVNVPLRNWAKGVRWNLFEVQQAMQRNNWDVIAGRMRSRKKNFDLGIQRTFFLGSVTDSNYPGLLNNANITVNTTLITALINSLTAANFQLFVQGIVQAYQANCAYVKYPDFFIIPQDDWNGLGTATSSVYPIGTMLDYLKKLFRDICGEHFEILPSAYGVPANNAAWTGLNKHLYLLGKRDGDSGHMNIPLDMIVTAPGTADNFNYACAGYAQYSGYNIFRNLDFLAFQF